jgi:two-component system chemotaxis response regulator CheY
MANLKILIADDFGTMQKIIRNILMELGYSRMVFANNGKKAHEILLKEKFDLVISDWNMPLMTGIELLKHVRADPEIAGTKFIMVTAEGEKNRIIEAIKANVDQYIIKPFTADALKEKIDAVFADVK